MSPERHVLHRMDVYKRQIRCRDASSTGQIIGSWVWARGPSTASDEISPQISQMSPSRLGRFCFRAAGPSRFLMCFRAEFCLGYQSRVESGMYRSGLFREADRRTDVASPSSSRIVSQLSVAAGGVRSILPHANSSIVGKSQR